MLHDACDLDLDPVTLAIKLDFDIMVTYFSTKNHQSDHLVQKLWPRQPDTKTNMCKTLTCRKSSACSKNQILLTWVSESNF